MFVRWRIVDMAVVDNFRSFFYSFPIIISCAACALSKNVWCIIYYYFSQLNFPRDIILFVFILYSSFATIVNFIRFLVSRTGYTITIIRLMCYVFQKRMRAHTCGFDYLRWFIPPRKFADKSPRHNSDRLFIYDYIRRYDDGVFHKYLKHGHTRITTGIFSLRHFIYCFFYSQHNSTRACHREIRDVLLKYRYSFAYLHNIGCQISFQKLFVIPTQHFIFFIPYKPSCIL